MRELSKEKQGVWVERLFSRLASFYGSAFGRQWDGTNLAEVKLAWAEKLGGFTADQIGDALVAIETKPYPPNLPEFILACRESARRIGRPAAPALPAPDIPQEVIEHRLQVLKRFGETFGKRVPAAEINGAPNE